MTVLVGIIVVIVLGVILVKAPMPAAVWYGVLAIVLVLIALILLALIGPVGGPLDRPIGNRL